MPTLMPFITPNPCGKNTMKLNAIIRTTPASLLGDKYSTYITIDGQDIEIGNLELLNRKGVHDNAEIVLQVSADFRDVADIVFAEWLTDNEERKLRANDNCLQGIRCPRCGSLDKFRIAIKTTATFGDDGDADDHSSDSSWDDDSYCECVDCRYDNTVQFFKDETFYREVEELHAKYRKD